MSTDKRTIRRIRGATTTTLLCWLITTASCDWRPRHERWTIPENYVGWLRLDYAIEGAPQLPFQEGAYIVRLPPGGRLRTSSPFNESIGEYFVATDHGLQKLAISELRMARHEPPVEEYAVQSVFGFFKAVNGSKKDAGTCVFVGTRAAFEASHDDCRVWVWGQPAPPPFKRKFVRPGPRTGRDE
jgi:hypothetical protein